MRILGISQLSLRRLNAVFSAGTIRDSSSSAAMRLVQFCHRGGEGSIRVGVEQAEGQGVIDLKAFDPSMPSTMRDFLEMGQKGMDCAKRYKKKLQKFNKESTFTTFTVTCHIIEFCPNLQY